MSSDSENEINEPGLTEITVDGVSFVEQSTGTSKAKKRQQVGIHIEEMRKRQHQQEKSNEGFYSTTNDEKLESHIAFALKVKEGGEEGSPTSKERKKMPVSASTASCLLQNNQFPSSILRPKPSAATCMSEISFVTHDSQSSSSTKGGREGLGKVMARPLTPLSQAQEALASMELQKNDLKSEADRIATSLARATEEGIQTAAKLVQSFYNGSDSGAAAVLSSITRRASPRQISPTGPSGILSTSGSYVGGEGRSVMGGSDWSWGTQSTCEGAARKDGAPATLFRRASEVSGVEGGIGSSGSSSYRDRGTNSEISFVNENESSAANKIEQGSRRSREDGLLSEFDTRRIPPVTVKVKDGSGEMVTVILFDSNLTDNSASKRADQLPPGVLCEGLVDLFSFSPEKISVQDRGRGDQSKFPAANKFLVRLYWSPSSPKTLRLESRSDRGSGEEGSAFGATLHISEYTLASLPPVYHDLYRLVWATVKTLRSRTPRLAIVSPDVTAVLMEDGPQPTLELTVRLPASGKLIGMGGWQKWQLTYRLRDHRLLVLPPSTSNSAGAHASQTARHLRPVVCYLKAGGPELVSAHARDSSSPFVSIVHASELPPHAMTLYVLAMRALPQCVALERGHRHSPDSVFPVIVRQNEHWLDDATRNALRME